MSGKKVLVICSSSRDLILKSGKVKQTGTFLNEFAEPLLECEKRGYSIVLATPSGNPPYLDPLGDRVMWFNWSNAKYLEARDFFVRATTNVRRLADVDEAELSTFSGLFIPGGHGALLELPENRDVGRILNFFHAQRKPIASLCHGPAALMAAKTLGGKWTFENYDVTCYSNVEEKMNEWMWWDTVPTKVEDLVKKAGGHYSKAFLPGGERVVVDRELITGQGPTSAKRLGREFCAALDASLAR